MNQRIVVAVVVKDGLVVSYATNEHKEPCKRMGYPTGEGYELCKGCQYDNHAEYKATRGDVNDGTLYLIGHTYACEPCKESCNQAGIKEIIIL